MTHLELGAGLLRRLDGGAQHGHHLVEQRRRTIAQLGPELCRDGVLKLEVVVVLHAHVDDELLRAARCGEVVDRAQVDAPIALGAVVCHEVEHVSVRHDQNALLGLALAVDLYTQSTPWASAVRHTLAVQMPFASAAASHAKCRALAVRTSSCVTRVHMPCAFRRAHAVCRAHVMPCTRLGHGAGPYDGVVGSRVGHERLEHLGVALELEVVRHATVRQHPRRHACSQDVNKTVGC